MKSYKVYLLAPTHRFMPFLVKEWEPWPWEEASKINMLQKKGMVSGTEKHALCVNKTCSSTDQPNIWCEFCAMGLLGTVLAMACYIYRWRPRHQLGEINAGKCGPDGGYWAAMRLHRYEHLSSAHRRGSSFAESRPHTKLASESHLSACTLRHSVVFTSLVI